MGKVSFRADDDIVDELEERGESKSQIIRDALEDYLAEEDHELDELYEGFEKYFSGLLSESDELVEEGGEILTEFDPHLGERAAHYAAKFESLYWE